MLVNKVKAEDIDNVALCHILAFPDSFSSRLGIKYIKKMLEWFIISNNRFLISIKKENQIVGYLGGAKGYGSTSSMIQYAFWQGVISIATKPYLLLDSKLHPRIRLIIKNIRKKFSFHYKKNTFRKKKIAKSETDVSIGLIVIGVHPEHRRLGIGSAMLNYFIIQSKLLGGDFGHLSVKSSNLKAIDAYLENHWEIVSADKDSTNLRIKIN